VIDDVEEILSEASGTIIRIPALVKGRLRIPPKLSVDVLRRAAAAAPSDRSGQQSPWFAVDGAQVLQQPVRDRESLEPTGDVQYRVLPELDPSELIESSPSGLARELYCVPFNEVVAYVGALGDVLRRQPALLAGVGRYAAASTMDDDRTVNAVFAALPELLDPGAFVEMVERELGDNVATGARYLDEWVPVPAVTHPGFTARLAERIRDQSDRPLHDAFVTHLRAMPTRQLHITAGNSPLVPFSSIMAAFGTKSAAVIKSAAEGMWVAALLAAAMHAVDPDHPLTRHTSLVYWKGGDARFEQPLFGPTAFDRLVVWGSRPSVDSVVSRAQTPKTIVFNPRYGLSLVGREAHGANIRHVAERAAVDSLVANQQACTSSLVHYVEGAESEVLDYCDALRQVLARWDHAIPHRRPRATVGRLRQLRRGSLLAAKWFENGDWPDTRSTVIYAPTSFDVELHPRSRCIIVRRLNDLREALPFVHPGVSSVGVYPEERRVLLRDELAAAGVSTIFPLGKSETVYPGIPHDGMRLLSELVNWTNA
jgi:hypothetical protein